jgi:fatty acid desaturase
MGEPDLQSHELVKQYPPKYWRVWTDIFFAYLFAVLIIFINLILAQKELEFLLQITILLASSVALSFLLHFLFLFLHEAGHWGLHPDKFWNDFFANLLIGFWFFWDIKLYRKTHWDHHLKHGKADDPENSYFLALTFNNLILAFLGIFAFKKVFDKKNEKNVMVEDKTFSLQEFRAPFFFAIYQLLIGTLFLSFNAYIEYFFVWCIPVFFGFPFLSFIRQVCEHRRSGVGSKTFDGQVHGPYTRFFKNTIGTKILGAAGFRLHWFHHYNPYISYTRLDDFALALRSDSSVNFGDAQEVTYFSVFKLLWYDAKSHAPR